MHNQYPPGARVIIAGEGDDTALATVIRRQGILQDLWLVRLDGADEAYSCPGCVMRLAT